MSSRKPVLIALFTSIALAAALVVGLIIINSSDAPAPVVLENTPAPDAPDAESIAPDKGETIADVAPVSPNREQKLESLTVRVLDATNGNPIRDASILLQKTTDGDGFVESIRTPKVVRGELRMNIPPGAYTIRARAHGFTSKSERITLIEGKSKVQDVLLSKGLSITGRVVDKNRRPIEGAEVRADWELGSPDDDMIEKLIGMTEMQEMQQEPIARDVTGPDGVYQLDGMKPMHYSVTALAAAHAPATREHVRPSARGVDFMLPDGSEITIVVTDFSQAPIAGAIVSVFPEVDSQDIFKVIETKSKPALATATTDSSGRALIDTLGAGLYNFMAKAPGFQRAIREKIAVRNGQNSEQRIVLQQGLLMAGQVVGPEGEPVAGAWIRPIRSGDMRQRVHIDMSDDGRIQTADDGTFTFDTLEEGKYSLLAWHSGDDYAAKQLRDVELGNTSLRITLDRGGAVSGVVTAAGTGEPVAGARVVVADLLDVKKDDITNENGEYYVGGVSAKRRGKRYVNVNAEGFARETRRSVNIQDGQETKNVNFELIVTATIAGRVVNSNGDPVARARVMAKKRSSGSSPVAVTAGSGATDENGKYVIDSVEAADEMWLEVMQQEYLKQETARFDVKPDERVEVNDIVLTLGGAVAGVVVDPEGRGVKGAIVAVRAAGETEFSSVKTSTTDQRGQFRIHGLLQGSVALQVRSTYFLEEVVDGIEVIEGRTTDNVRIQVRPGNRLTGMVVDAGDRPVSGARVTVREFAAGIQEHSQTTDGQGRFAFNTLAGKEPVEVQIEHSEFSPYTNQSVEVSDEEVVIKLVPLGGVRGVVLDSGNEPIASFSVQPKLQAPAGTPSTKRLGSKNYQPADGFFQYMGLPAGTYSVSANAPGYAAFSVTDVVVRNGEVVDLGRIILREGGVIEGHVVDAETGEPIAGVQMRVQGGPSKFRPSSTSPASARSSRVTTQTDASGHFKFTDLRGGDVTVSARKAPYVDAKVTVNPDHGSAARGVQIRLSRGGEIFGVVANSAGEPVAKMRVILKGVGEIGSEGNQDTRTDEQGRFSFKRVPAGSYQVRTLDFKRRNNPSFDIDMGAGGSVQVDLVFED